MMTEQPITRPSLLVSMRDPRDGRAWSRFVAIYTPLIYQFARRRGLQAADAADVTQEVFRAVARSIRRFDYDCRKGSFRGWLIAVARSKLHDFLGKQAARAAHGNGKQAILENQPSPGEEEAQLESDHRRFLLDWAVSEIRDEFQPTTWQAFWQTSFDGKPTREVAEQLGMTVGAVYIARSRVIARLKAKISEAEEP